jgi:hypothetical protein
MKKLMNWMLATILICGASVFTSCTSNDDNPATPDLNVAQKIMGRWISASVGGKALPTNDKMVYNFISTTEAYISSSFSARPDFEAQWVYLSRADVVVAGNKVTITHHPDEQQTVRQEFTITAINDNEFTANMHVKITANGNSLEADDVVRFTKVKVDYSADIIGMWEGRSTGAEGSEFDDGENHRWEYLLDGTFNYFHKDDLWQISDDEYADYFVAGNLLCTRWKNAGEGNEEHREWWEIESIKDGVMKWKALRQREDGSTYTATFEMKKIELSPSDYKCSRVEVIYRITSPKTNYTFFEGKYAVKSGGEVTIDKLPTFAGGYNSGYNVTDITTFPVEEAICLHYGIKDGLESYAGDYSLNWEMSYTVTSYNAEGYKLDSQTISDRFSVNGKIQKKEDLEMDEKMSYSELHASVAEDGMITLSRVNKMHPERSGIDW